MASHIAENIFDGYLRQGLGEGGIPAVVDAECRKCAKCLRGCEKLSQLTVGAGLDALRQPHTSLTVNVLVHSCPNWKSRSR
jgi:hypothetical protein